MQTYVVHWQDKRLIGQHLIIGDEAACVRDIIGAEPVPANLITKIEVYDSDEHTADVVTEDVARATARAAEREQHEGSGGVSVEVWDFIHDYAGSGFAHGLRILDSSFAAA